jgi:hypothetical protein
VALFNRSRASGADDIQLVELPPEPAQSTKATKATKATNPDPVPDRPVAAGPDEPGLPPSRMRGTESLYGYVVGLELVVVAILTLVMHGGKGAPKHPQTGLQIAGLIGSIAFFAVLQRRSRTLTAFAAIAAAFIVTLPAVPDSLRTSRIFVLAVPLAYGLIITQRQRKATGLSMRGTRTRSASAGPGTRTDTGSKGRRSATDAARPPARRRGRGQDTPAPAGPRPSPRYTPPKPKRGSTRAR